MRLFFKAAEMNASPVVSRNPIRHMSCMSAICVFLDRALAVDHRGWFWNGQLGSPAGFKLFKTFFEGCFWGDKSGYILILLWL